MIPKNITKQHILKALQDIDKNGIKYPLTKSKRFDLVFQGKAYPPKYTISIANQFANEEYLSHREFSTYEAQNYLTGLSPEFSIREKNEIDPLVGIIEKYKKQLRQNKLQGEIYKWQLVQNFRGRPNLQASDLLAELKSIPYGNMIYGVGLGAVYHLAKDRPEQYRACFQRLFNESTPLAERLNNFNSETLKIYRELVPKETLSHHQDERTMSTFLTVFNPDKYAFYKDSFYRKYCKLVDEKPKGKGEKYLHYLDLMDNFISDYIAPDVELVKMVDDLLPPGAYRDPGHRILAQDILYTMLDKGIEEIEIGNFSVYKISMGSFDDAEVEEFIKSKKVLVHSNTGAIGTSTDKQGDVYKSGLNIGDFFYLTHGNKADCMKLIGRITGEAIPITLADENSGWLERSFEIITTSKNKAKYSDVRKWWTPNANTTIVEIKEDDLEEANKILFEPYFRARMISNTSDETNTQENLLKNESKPKANSSALNQILFGPPGTGKTYNSINRAISIIENKSDSVLKSENREALKKRFNQYILDGQIEFTTFHQSMSYEDFIEGIKPLKPFSDDMVLKYDIQPGLFYNICEKAKSNFENSKLENMNKLNFEDAFEKFKEEWEQDQKMKFPLKTDGYDFTIYGFTNTSIQFEKASGGRSHTLSIGTLKDLYYGKKYNFKQGVGIYYPSILKKVLTYQSETKSSAILKNFVIIIDEINRGNVSQIFGELITLIEIDKRLGNSEELEVILPYSKAKFGVPPNLYIIGTMNTADRSVEALDTALRRRFSFEEIPPSYSVPNLDYQVFGIEAKDILKTINARIEKLIDKDHQIGHSYFMYREKENAVECLMQAFSRGIIPLLQEYFYGDFGKIGLVLGKGFVTKQEWNENRISFADFDHESANTFDDRDVYKLTCPDSTADFEEAITILMNLKGE